MNQQTGNPVAPISQFAAHSNLYHTDPEKFAEEGGKRVKSWLKARQENEAAKADMIPFGLLAAAPLLDFFGGLNRTPLWLGKDDADYLRAFFGLKDGTEVPKDAVTNAVLVLTVVHVRKSDDGKTWRTEAGPFTEANYLASSQHALNLLKRVVLNPAKFGPDGYLNLEDEDVKSALNLASTRPNKFEKALKEIADRVSPPKGRKKSEAEAEVAGAEPATDHAVVATVKGALAHLAAKASMPGGLTEIAKELGADAGLAVMFVKSVTEACRDSAIGSAPGLVGAVMVLSETLDQKVVEEVVGSAVPAKVRKAATKAAAKRAAKAAVPAVPVLAPEIV